MSPPSGRRTQACSAEQGRTRLGRARKLIEVAELVSTEEAISESVSVAAALTVLAGIAAADASCCAALGRRSRSADHHDAEDLLKQIVPGGPAAAQKLRRIINEKDSAHYGLVNVSGQALAGLMRQARALIDFADEVLRR
jgi:hypothetical protein